jgi:hypothetical protein
MPGTYIFECEKCKYLARVAGGLAEGLEFRVQTILCQDCGEIRDAVIAARMPENERRSDGTSDSIPKPPPLAELMRRLLFPTGIKTEWQSFKPACEVSAFHVFRLWNDPDLCPKCGVFLERNITAFRRWD